MKPCKDNRQQQCINTESVVVETRWWWWWFGPVGYQEGLIGALAEGGVVGAVHRRLAGELGVKLTHVFG